jgi:hypothetical protein
MALKIPPKISFLPKCFCLLLTVGTFKSVFKDNNSLGSHKKVFLNFLPYVEGSGSVQIIMGPDPDPGSFQKLTDLEHGFFYYALT